MEYMTLIWSICVLAESKTKSEIDLEELIDRMQRHDEKALEYIREVVETVI